MAEYIERGALFQSTLPVWGGTMPTHRQQQQWGVSIHPPRVGRDARGWEAYSCDIQVSIHPPRVGRDPILLLPAGKDALFQSTLPVWGGTDRASVSGSNSACFNPPSPCGEGQNVKPGPVVRLRVSIHPPRVGRDNDKATQDALHKQFQSTLPVWGGTDSRIRKR